MLFPVGTTTHGPCTGTHCCSPSHSSVARAGAGATPKRGRDRRARADVSEPVHGTLLNQNADSRPPTRSRAADPPAKTSLTSRDLSRWPEARAELLVDLLQVLVVGRGEELAARDAGPPARALPGRAEPGSAARSPPVSSSSTTPCSACRRARCRSAPRAPSPAPPPGAAGSSRRRARRRRSAAPRAAAWTPSSVAARARAARRARSRRRSPVPSPGLSESSAVVDEVSVLGGRQRRRSRARRTRRRRSGTSRDLLGRTPWQPALAASSRVGSTSSAFIERETSIASTTVASSRGTLTTACGRATPTTIAVSATSRIAIGR